MFILVVTIALAPSFVPMVTRTPYLTELDCRVAAIKATDIEARDGVIVIARCEPK